MNKSILSILVILFFSCSEPASPEAKVAGVSTAQYFNYGDTGVATAGIRMIPIQTPKGAFKVWTKRIGNNPKIKVLLLHGGPAMGHQYMEAFESYFPKEGIEFYYYDQLGSSYSDVPSDSSLWTTARFVEEVEQVRTALGLNKDNFFLLGHSWGGILATEYALKYGQHLKGLIISNMMSSCPAYDKYAEVLASKMDPQVVQEIKQLEAEKKFTDPRYEALLFPHFYSKHVCRLSEWPEPLMRTLKFMNKEIYTIMQGPSEFGISGRLENWDRSKDLPKLTMPVLTIGGQWDTMDPQHMKWMSTQVKNGTYLHCPNGSHMSMWDDQQAYMKGVIDWLKDKGDSEK